MHQLCFYVPATHVDAVKAAVFAAGAGKIGDYDHCCWQSQGEGQFRPLPGSQPHLGKENTIETVAEFKIECVVADAFIEATIKALKQAHPYETVAYSVWPLSNHLYETD